MKSKFSLFASIIQLVVGILAIVSFFVLGINGEIIAKWIITLILAILFVIIGITGIINYTSDK